MNSLFLTIPLNESEEYIINGVLVIEFNPNVTYSVIGSIMLNGDIKTLKTQIKSIKLYSVTNYLAYRTLFIINKNGNNESHEVNFNFLTNTLKDEFIEVNEFENNMIEELYFEETHSGKYYLIYKSNVNGSLSEEFNVALFTPHQMECLRFLK